jgi:hypothetical protein
MHGPYFVPDVRWVEIIGFLNGSIWPWPAPNIQPTIQVGDTDGWIGPFTLDVDTLTEVFSNFVADGLYKEDGSSVVKVDVDLELELTPVDNNGNPIGSPEVFATTLEGSVSKTPRAVTVRADPTFEGKCAVRARRTSDSDYEYTGTVVDDVKWRDLYAISPVSELHFGGVTTVQIRSLAIEGKGSLSGVERKLNMLVTRKIPLRTGSGVWSETLSPTNNAAEILAAVCFDPFIGNRDTTEIDDDNIYAVIDAVVANFGSAKAGEFNYTFDKDNISFEETVSSICAAVFCKAYRRGSRIQISFEKDTTDSVLLFNHRNKIPKSEVRTIRFGLQDDTDGLEFEYVDPIDDAVVTFYLPEDRSAINPKKIESIGIRSKLQAHFHAWREWNRLQYQNIGTEFEATQEADLLLLGDRVLVADGTRPYVQDGDVLSQNVLELELSQDTIFTLGRTYTIFLQHTDGTVESLGVTAGSSKRHVILGDAPRLALATDPSLYARSAYMIVDDSDVREKAFIVAEKEPQSNFTSTVRAINYDARYYQNDTDFINDVIDEDGEPVPV